MATINEAILVAVGHHQAGRLEQAAEIYRRVLDASPEHAEALHLLGVVAVQQGRFQEGVELISRAIHADARQAAFHSNLAEAYRGVGRVAEARASYEEALRLQPVYPEVRSQLAAMAEREGRFAQAADSYRQVVAARPDNAASWSGLGACLVQLGQWDAALEACQRAVALDPRQARAHANLGRAWGARGQLDRAIAAFTQAVALNPGDVETRFDLGMALQQQQQLDLAAEQYRQALRLKPDHVAALNSLGVVYQAQDRLAESRQLYEQAVQVDPRRAEAHYNLGTVLNALKQPAEAVAAYRRAIECEADFAEAWFNMGTTLFDMHRKEDATTAVAEAARLCPDFPLVHTVLGNIYRSQGKLSDAIQCYRRALEVDAAETLAKAAAGRAAGEGGGKSLDCIEQARREAPQYVDAHNNLGAVYQEQGMIAEALACYAQCLRANPEFPQAHMNRSLLLLAEGNFAEGWPEFEWRLECKTSRGRGFSQPTWDGSDWTGKRLLVHAEQGLGDTIMFIRYLEQVKQRGGTPLVEVQKALLPLFKLAGIEAIGCGEPLPAFDVHAPMLSLPGILRTTFDTLPAPVPYLHADPRLAERWHDKLAAIEGFKVGIHWQGNRDYEFDRHRSIPLAEFAPLAGIPGVRLVSLQKGTGVEQLAELGQTLNIYELGDEVDREHGPFMDTAAIIQNLDLVIACDTATVHLAGALGARVWLPLFLWPEWRWFLNRDDSPWYPTMRLFRQTQAGAWGPVFERMADELRRLVAGRAG